MEWKEAWDELKKQLKQTEELLNETSERCKHEQDRNYCRDRLGGILLCKQKMIDIEARMGQKERACSTS